MKLFTKSLERRFEQIGSQEGKGLDSIVVVKFLFPVGDWCWLATEYDAENQIFYGYVHERFQYWDTFSLQKFIEINELTKSKPTPFDAGIQRDNVSPEMTVREHLRFLRS